ncbi:hypothetical protein AB4Y64_14545 [Lysobacter sp. TAF61]|uniref:hypothetical protein n=1 Tax=Lysobacter sp. TAF61 TaxID=3233072 RepID=UPI003F978229
MIDSAATALQRAADASWFPLDLDVPARSFSFARLDVEALERSTFMDTRLDAAIAQVEAVQADALAAMPAPAAPPAWLLHTSFCGSTLLARALHVPPHQVALKEPLVLRRLGDARHAGRSLGDLCELSARLLSRPWSPGGGVLVKATHAALNVAPDLLAAIPASRAVVLTSSLDDFLVSNLKKSAETQAKIPALAERALQAGTLHLRLPSQAMQPPDLLCAAALQWAGQRDLVMALATRFGEARVRVVDFDALLASPVEVAVACSRWLQLPASEADITARASEVSSRNAKAVSVSYGAGQRAQEAQLVLDRYADAISRARDWANRYLQPALETRLPMTAVEHWT